MSRFGIALSLISALALPSAAAAVEKSAPFALDQWIDIKATEGPVTIHRIRLAAQHGITKSSIMRPGNSEYLSDVQIQVEFSNEATDDWKAQIHFRWLDAEGKVIDGYNGGQTLDSEAKYEQQTVTLSTLRYGLDRAKKVEIEISLARD